MMLGVDPPAKVTKAVLDGMGLRVGTRFDNRKDALSLARRLLAYCAMTPTFQAR